MTQKIRSEQTDFGGAWQSWTPSWTNLTVGNGTVNARYKQIGKTVFFSINLIFGSTTSITGAAQVSIPVTGRYNDAGASPEYGQSVSLRDASATRTYPGSFRVANANAGFISCFRTSIATTPADGDAYAVACTSTIPFVWDTGDVISITGTYEAE